MGLVPLVQNKGNCMRIDYVKSGNATEALENVKTNISEEHLEKMQVKADITDNGSDLLEAKGKGFDLTVKFYENYLDLDLNLSFMLKPFKGKIVGYLEREVKKVI